MKGHYQEKMLLRSRGMKAPAEGDWEAKASEKTDREMGIFLAAHYIDC
jgi:hypothetical protein